MSTYMAKEGTLTRRWFVIDAADQIVGRLAVQIATILRGKHRPEYTPHVDTGDYVIVVTVEKVRFTGTKMATKTSAWSTRAPTCQTPPPSRDLLTPPPNPLLPAPSPTA